MHINQTSQNINNQQQQIDQYYLQKLIAQKYLINSIRIKLSKEQINNLIGRQEKQDQQDQVIQQNQLFSAQKINEIEQFIKQSPNKSIYLKLANRTPKDLNPFLQKIHNTQQLMIVLTTSEYILDEVQPQNDKQYFLIIREFYTSLSSHQNHYEVYVKQGVTIAIVQRFLDHVGKQLSKQIQSRILSAVQIILAGVSIGMAGCKKQGQKYQPNSFIVKIFCNQNLTKILGIHKFTEMKPLNTNSLITQQQLTQYYKNSIQPKLISIKTNKNTDKQSQNIDEIFHINENIIPKIKILKDHKNIKKYDMGQYMMGNEIKDQSMLSQWKQFIKQADIKIKQQK